MASSPAGAQIGAGALVGRVVDQDGAAAPGVTVTITAVGTNASRLAVTEAGGRYVFSGLAPGLYRVRLELSGFRPLTREGVRIATGETVRLDLQLELGGVTEAVTVTADAPLLRSENIGLLATSSTTGKSSTCRSTAGASSRSRAWLQAWPCRRRPRRRSRASTAAGRAPTNICSTASRSSSPSPVRSRSFRTSTRFRSSRSRATARPPSSAASTAAWST